MRKSAYHTSKYTWYLTQSPFMPWVPCIYLYLVSFFCWVFVSFRSSKAPHIQIWCSCHNSFSPSFCFFSGHAITPSKKHWNDPNILLLFARWSGTHWHLVNLMDIEYIPYSPSWAAAYRTNRNMCLPVGPLFLVQEGTPVPPNGYKHSLVWWR